MSFGRCLDCDGPVERVGWDDLCFACQESEKAELLGEDDEDCGSCSCVVMCGYCGEVTL